MSFARASLSAIVDSLEIRFGSRFHHTTTATTSGFFSCLQIAYRILFFYCDVRRMLSSFFAIHSFSDEQSNYHTFFFLSLSFDEIFVCLFVRLFDRTILRLFNSDFFAQKKKMSSSDHLQSFLSKPNRN